MKKKRDYTGFWVAGTLILGSVILLIKRKSKSKGLGFVNNEFEKYFLSRIDASGYDVKQPKTDKEKVIFLLNTFKSEKSWELQKSKNWKSVFKDWTQGLPSSFNIDYTDYDISNLMWLFGFQIEDEERAVDEYWNSLPQVFYSLIKKYDLKF